MEKLEKKKVKLKFLDLLQFGVEKKMLWSKSQVTAKLNIEKFVLQEKNKNGFSVCGFEKKNK